MNAFFPTSSPYSFTSSLQVFYALHSLLLDSLLIFLFFHLSVYPSLFKSCLNFFFHAFCPFLHIITLFFNPLSHILFFYFFPSLSYLYFPLFLLFFPLFIHFFTPVFIFYLLFPLLSSYSTLPFPHHNVSSFFCSFYLLIATFCHLFFRQHIFRFHPNNHLFSPLSLHFAPFYLILFLFRISFHFFYM